MFSGIWSNSVHSQSKINQVFIKDVELIWVILEKLLLERLFDDEVTNVKVFDEVGTCIVDVLLGKVLWLLG